MTVDDQIAATRTTPGTLAKAIVAEATSREARLLVLPYQTRSSGAAGLTTDTVEALIRDSLCPLVLVPADSPAVAVTFAVRRIVVPLDGSASAERVLPVVSDVAVLTGSAITLLHVITPASGAARFSFSYPSGMSAAARGYLTRLAERLRTQEMSVDAVLVSGFVDPAINAVAEGQGADLIAMTASRRKGLARLLAGNSSLRVLRSSTIPLMVVPPNASLSPDEYARFGASALVP
jgi:nucleotide-binding universal stress UspA family protein